MLYHLLFPLRDTISGFNVFQYITFRSAGAVVTALILSLMLGPAFIRMLRRLAVGQSIREEGPKRHREKAGTPTMGGLLILLAVVLATILWARLDNLYVWLALTVTLAFGAVGFADDYLKIRRGKNLGLTPGAKLLLQCLVAGAAAWVLMTVEVTPPFETLANFPFFKQLLIPLGWLYIPFVMVVLIGSSNAVNLTDGLDGLAIGATLVAAATYAVFTYVAGHAIAADYLQVVPVPGVGEVTIFCGALIGASLGFLWYNCHPAQVFMGDVGSLSIGGAIATVAVLSRQELLLVLVGGLFVLEALSVILQVGSFKLRGKRVFRMAPLHHHFELSGWPESKVIVRFWILSILFALLSLSTLKLR
ncbi:MAG: phospho-N-acetylmuramoyl-pentapeptide-transferase [Thermoanaerobaculia bacterium]|nr:phospho-N-acetylmuramoyl-pentapeptide-transferase [Thermoanaerobaculia bacterium]